MTATSSSLTRDETTVERSGNHLRISAPFLDDRLRTAIADAWYEERRVAFEEFGYAENRFTDSVNRDTCASGPPETSEETERLAEEADERWADLDLSGSASVSLAEARRLYELLGAALAPDVAADGYVGRLIPAARAAA